MAKWRLLKLTRQMSNRSLLATNLWVTRPVKRVILKTLTSSCRLRVNHWWLQMYQTFPTTTLALGAAKAEHQGELLLWRYSHSHQNFSEITFRKCTKRAVWTSTWQNTLKTLNSFWWTCRRFHLRTTLKKSQTTWDSSKPCARIWTELSWSDPLVMRWSQCTTDLFYSLFSTDYSCHNKLSILHYMYRVLLCIPIKKNSRLLDRKRVKPKIHSPNRDFYSDTCIWVVHK